MKRNRSGKHVRGAKQVELPRIESEHEAYFDGACWPNPNGHAACGALLKRSGIIIWEYSSYSGNQDTSNNVAEYQGLNAVLSFLISAKITNCVIYGDSNLVIKQMNKEWSAGKLTKKEKSGKIPIRARYYMPEYKRAQELLAQLPNDHGIKFRWIPREKNTEADDLSSKPLRERGIKNVYGYNR